MGEALIIGRAHAFERGDKLYLTTPVSLARPTTEQIEEFAFSSAVKSMAPNENIGWLSGPYVEAGNPNLNNAMWLNEELAVAAVTPMLMPVTVMHDPRTAVGTIADTKLHGRNEQHAHSRIDTILAIWKHRFPGIWDEAEANIAQGQMMQSMECFSPWYKCSECAQVFHKLPNGAEQASWCAHLRGNDSSRGRRILGDVCFTGTGLIFGTRGGVGAYTEAYLDHFHDEIAEYHERAHHDSTYRPSDRSEHTMGMVNIDENELATLRQERNEARSEVDRLKGVERDLTTQVEKAQAEKVAAETAKATAEQTVTQLQEQAQAATLRETRMNGLGKGFLGKLGDFSKQRLTEIASKASDEEWDNALKEREELAGVLRSDAGDGSPAAPAGGSPASAAGSSEGSGFASEEVASFMRGGIATQTGSGAAPKLDPATSVRKLARSLAPKQTTGAKS
jgi:hypothetical protein